MAFKVRHAVLTLALAAGVATTGLPALVAAQDATPASSPEAMGPPPAPAYATVVATGLMNPRGMFVDADGNVWVAESGVGGDGPCAMGPEGNEECMGHTGAVTKIAADGTSERVLDGLASRAAEGGSSATGPNDVAVLENQVYVLFGFGGDPATRVDLGAEDELGFLMVDDGNGLQPVVDVAAYETDSNPDGQAVDSNPYSLLPAAEGALVVSDAGGNALLNVTAEGEISTLTVFPNREATAPDGSEIPMNPVPTGIAADPNGSIVVGELTGFPFPVGGATVVTVGPDGGEPISTLDGFTNVIDVAVGPDGSTYVLEMLKSSMLGINPEDPTTLEGQLTRVSLDGERTVVASEGLVWPTGLAVDADGNIFVATWGVMGNMGQVWKIAPPA
ncbi:MAG: ScyD/ScyE family protein [Thermomicrobiales bacterium]|nr:ScyD/ScyE family protein [Thermomicrobiales bacterium]